MGNIDSFIEIYWVFLSAFSRAFLRFFGQRLSKPLYVTADLYRHHKLQIQRAEIVPRVFIVSGAAIERAVFWFFVFQRDAKEFEHF